MKLVPEHPEDPNSEVTQEQIDRAHEALWQAYCREVGGDKDKCHGKPPKGWDPYEVPKPQQPNTAPGDNGDKSADWSCHKSNKDDGAVLKCLPAIKIWRD